MLRITGNLLGREKASNCIHFKVMLEWYITLLTKVYE